MTASSRYPDAAAESRTIADGADPNGAEPEVRLVSSDEPDRAHPALSPDAVAGREFATARKGYDRAEVRAFLTTVAAELAAVFERISELERLAARTAMTAGDAEPANAEALLEAIAADAWRDQVLADLDRRRRELNSEVMRLRAGRDRLRADLVEVADELADQSRRLDGSLQAARSAGDLAEQKVTSESPRSAEEWRAELEAARLAGFATVGAASTAAAEPRSPEDAHEPSAADPDVGATMPDGDVGEALEVGELFARLRAERSGAPLGADRARADS
ncbi:MAG: DivIVA domain-containing protein [Acidimicrobiia bacterium]|nr:DivIVA domain-containing protein [Acidimicrobiia bacterium]